LEGGFYLDQNSLVKLLKENRAQLLVVDTRDEDHAGGHVIGSVHFPDSTFDPAALSQLVLNRNSTVVVFHCMESARRGPRCAFRFNKYCQESYAAQTLQSIPQIFVLKGGADLWIRRFVGKNEDPSLVQDFDNEYWGWDLDVEQKNVLYQRPSDQPQTEWSPAGTK